MTESIAESLARLRSADAKLQAFTCVLDEARVRRQSGALLGPLAGQWVALKDIFDTADLPTGYGSPIYAGHQPACDAAIVGVLRRAGALVIGKAVTTEFAYLQPAATLNPAAPGRTPGGSSAGSAAAVAAGLVPFAVGSQTGGSVIRPASYCGVAGFKPTLGVLPTAGMKCFSWSLDTVGLFARTVEAVGRFAHAVTGGRAGPASARDAGHWTVGIPRDYPWGELSASAAKALDQAADAMREAGARVVDCELPRWVHDAFAAHDAIQGWEAARALATEFERHAAVLSPLLFDYLTEARTISDASYASAQASARSSRAACRRWLHDIDVVLTPSAPDEAPEGYTSTGGSTFNRAWTLLGTPCVNVPGATGVNGYPMGVQVIAPPNEDGRCLAAGMMLEKMLKG